MSLRKPQYVVTDIDFENDDEEAFRYDTHDSNPDEVLSQYSNSDLQEFNNFERDIYGSIDDASSEDKLNMHPLPDDHHTSADEVSDSLRLVLPNIQIRPFLGDPIQTYDQLRGQYKHELPSKNIINSPVPSDFSQITPIEKKPSPYDQRARSQASGGSAETVLSQNEELEEPSTMIVPSKPKSRNMPSSVSSTESTARHSSHRSKNKATQKILLDQERVIRKDQDKYINHLQHTINQLLTKHALAEETIDQLRLGVVINTKTKYNEQRPQRRPSSSVKKKIMSRRYSSIVDNANFQDYEDGPNIMSRAKSVDMGMFEEEPANTDFSYQQHLSNELGGSMKQMTKTQSKETEIANDIRTIGDYFQSRIKILNEAANNLQYNSSGRASVSSGSYNGDVSVPLGKIIYDSQRHTPLAKRFKDLQTAYSDLQSDFNGFRQINKNSASENASRNDNGLHNVEGNLFELGMKIDDLERTIAEGVETPIDNRVLGGLNRENELISRFANVEEQYENLMDRYNSLKGSRSPVRQRQLDDIVQQLQSLAKQANGRYSNIPTPDKLESMMQQDIIDKIKQHMASDSPPYFLTEEDGLSSGHSSFGRNRRRRHRVPRSDEDSDYKPQPVERLSPIKSRISTHIYDEDIDRRISPQHAGKPNSLPVSVVSSSSMWHGATSGETLALDDQGVLRDSVSRKGNSSIGSEVFEYPNKSIEEIHQSRRQSKTNSFFNPRSKSDLSNPNIIPNNSPLHDDIKRLDAQLEKVELEEKRQISAARDSDAAGSRNTRSLLGTSPSNSIMSKHSRQPSSVASSHKSQGTSSGHGNYSHTMPKDERPNRRIKSRYIVPDSVSDSDNDTPSDEYDVVDYVKSAGCGLGPRSRYVRSKNKNVQDRWSQTPPVFNKRPSNLRAYGRGYPGELDDPYIDDVAYWDGETFHPSRESIPGKSILRRSSPHSKHRGNRHRNRSQYITPDIDRFPRMSDLNRVPMSHCSEPNISREYYPMDPHRYLVREYGQRMPALNQSIFEEESGDDYSPYENYVEERRLRNYLDEAVKAAQSMKRYTKRISELCEQRKFEDNFANLSAQRNYRDFYTQYS